MKLTRRQIEFIENLIDLSREIDGPIHYSALAERLGVSPFTAYDMLRVLEEKGMVVSEYRLAEGKSGPGRTERLFYPAPTMSAKEEMMARQMGLNGLDCGDMRQLFLERAQQGEFPDPDLARELLARIPPDGPEDIRYGVEVLTIMALRLQPDTGRQTLLAYLPLILPDGGQVRTGLTLLGGFCFGLLAQEGSTDEEWTQMMLEHIQQYLDLVGRLSLQACDQLAEALTSVFLRLNTDPELELARR